MRLNPHYDKFWDGFLAWAYYLSQRYNEAVDALVRKGRLSIVEHRMLAASYVQLGRMDMARARANETLKIDPEFTLSRFRTYIQRLRLYKNETDIEHFIDDLRKAGLPE